MVTRVVFHSCADAKKAAFELSVCGYLFTYDQARKITIYDRDAYDVALCYTERFIAFIAPFAKPTSA